MAKKKSAATKAAKKQVNKRTKAKAAKATKKPVSDAVKKAVKNKEKAEKAEKFAEKIKFGTTKKSQKAHAIQKHGGKEKFDAKMKTKHARAVKAWEAGGKKGPKPSLTQMKSDAISDHVKYIILLFKKFFSVPENSDMKPAPSCPVWHTHFFNYLKKG